MRNGKMTLDGIVSSHLTTNAIKKIRQPPIGHDIENASNLSTSCAPFVQVQLELWLIFCFAALSGTAAREGVTRTATGQHRSASRIWEMECGRFRLAHLPMRTARTQVMGQTLFFLRFGAQKAWHVRFLKLKGDLSHFWQGRC